MHLTCLSLQDAPMDIESLCTWYWGPKDPRSVRGVYNLWSYFEACGTIRCSFTFYRVLVHFYCLAIVMLLKISIKIIALISNSIYSFYIKNLEMRKQKMCSKLYFLNTLKQFNDINLIHLPGNVGKNWSRYSLWCTDKKTWLIAPRATLNTYGLDAGKYTSTATGQEQ